MRLSKNRFAIPQQRQRRAVGTGAPQLVWSAFAYVLERKNLRLIESIIGAQDFLADRIEHDNV
jgi:hypothetical protein